ncbi:MAG: O-antigen ligase family protein [Deltaproteobacteria bacterium]|nr:MAG: O-antigen ligase family protein [Deltaproteobacteria bacterium]
MLFLVSCAMAPIEIELVASFTVYDLLTTVLFLLVLARGTVILPSPGILASALVFLLFALLSTLRALQPGESLTQILQYVFIFCVQLPVIFAFARSRFMLQAGLFAFFAGSLVAIVDAYLSPQQLWADRVSTFFSESPNRLGYPVAYLSPFLACFVLQALRRRRWRLSSLVAASAVAYLMVWALAASGSRGAAVSTFVSMTVFLGFRRGAARPLAVLARTSVAVLILGLCGSLLYRSDQFPPTLRERIHRTLAAERTLVHDRTLLAIGGLRAFEESPIVGLGLDNFRFVADRYVPTVTQQNPHNLWIQLLAQTGIFGTLGFLGIVACSFGIVLAAQRQKPSAAHRELLWALIAAMCATMVIFLFIPILIQRHYWWLFGMAMSAARGSGSGGRAALAQSIETEDVDS